MACYEPGGPPGAPGGPARQPRTTEGTIENPVFVIGADLQGLTIAQTLGRRGVACWSCNPERIIGTVSRYVRYWRVPDPQRDEAGMIARVLELAERVGGRPVLIPTHDHFAQALARNRGRLDNAAIVCAAPAEVVEMLVDKSKFRQWAQEHELSCPKAVPATKFAANGALSFPVVATPKHLRFSDSARLQLPPEAALYALRFTLIENEAEWQDYGRRHADLLPHIQVQEFVRGTSADGLGIGIYADGKSEIQGLFAGRKLRGWPAQYGEALAVQSERVPESVLAEVERVVRALGYTGIAEFEYKRDAETGAYRLLEINARCWWWMGITTASPANIPWIAYQDLIGRPTARVWHNGPTGEIKYVYLLKDFANVILRYRWDHPAWVMSPAKWWKSLAAEKLVIVDFTRDDLPASVWNTLIFIKFIFKTAWNALFRR